MTTIETFAQDLADEFNLPVQQATDETCRTLGANPGDSISDETQEAIRWEHRMNSMP